MKDRDWMESLVAIPFDALTPNDIAVRGYYPDGTTVFERAVFDEVMRRRSLVNT